METDFERARLKNRINRVEQCRLDSSDSGQGQVAGSCEQGTEPYKSGGNFFTGWGPISFSSHCSKESESVHLTYLPYQRHNTGKL